MNTNSEQPTTLQREKQMTPEECMITIGTHHVTDTNFWGAVREFTERQIPRRMTNTNGSLSCPVCRFHVMYEVNFCPKCGQKLCQNE